ncbi:nuclease-related domain-containing protein [Sulfobacillus thermosulfidooxidans]|uniref:nuclease-related domain-containing protein n=1 Tax=Sulfobacillus thermosulfidooxidans TaxID=28034 RepID=UPI00096B6B07|nr:nuclease-related domain-containing protein [Sulfobacillus thermosulfidooxidans]OLZ11998.1 hypothetical protein BFX05_05870 [Sulfobacillus thermosulfidooxidans]OLZ16750.1 hypothetical protein BFX06_14725 [Sulfobacillus thermosulfidooxidans]OLZ20701.1 hypothetical protein BFX07_14555 [Sulfobacillus thermosulfidooxidans]
MARVYMQSHELKAKFLQRIQDKMDSKEQNIKDRITTQTPQFLHWVLKPLAIGMVRRKQQRDSHRGAHGEFSVGLWLQARLPKTWVIINDVVLEYQTDEYAQIDHIVMGPPGIFLIETKAWDGAILLKKDQSFRKEGGKWVKVSSPIQQNKTHQRRFRQWYKLQKLPEPLPPIEPIVVFSQATWLAVDQCSMPVLTPRQTASHLYRRSDNVIDDVTINRILQSILTPTIPPLEQIKSIPSSNKDNPRQSAYPSQENGVKLQEGTTRQGRKYVRIYGSREAAENIWRQYGKPGRLSKDQFKPDTFFFYRDD